MRRRLLARLPRRVLLTLVAGSLVVAHAATLGGVGSATLASWSQPADVIPDEPVGCGETPPGLPCLVPAGATIVGDLAWATDVIVLGTVTGRTVVDGGSVTVGATGVVGGDVVQLGPGPVDVLLGGFVGGSVDEAGDGFVLVDGAVLGDVSETGDGEVVVAASAEVDGVIREADAGSARVTGATVGTIVESDAGDLTVDAASVVAVADSTGTGTCTISPLATVEVRLGACA